MKPKVTYIISKVNKAVAFEWIVEELHDQVDFEFLLLNDNRDTDLARFLTENKIPLVQFPMGNKKQFPVRWFQLFKHLIKSKPDVIHTHLFEASLLGLSAAKMAGIKYRVYTRHHSTYHHRFFPKAIRYDRWINALASHIIAISNNVKQVLLEKEQVDPNKLVLIEHGFRLNLFSNRSEEEVSALREKYQIPSDRFVVGVVSRYIEWKGVEYAVQGFAGFQKKCPNAHLVLANAGGPHEKVIREAIQGLEPGTFSEIPFEPNLYGLYGLFDAFVHVPIDAEIEAFGQTYVEALAAGVPSIFTLSGIAKDFVKGGENALCVSPKKEGEVTKALFQINEDQGLREQLIRDGKKSVNRFELSQMTGRLNELYQSAL